MAIKNLKQQTQDLSAELKTIGHRGYLLMSLFLFIGLLALLFFGIMPKVNGFFNQKNQIKEEEIALQNLNDRFIRIQNLAQDIDLAQIEKVDQILYDNNPFLAILHALTQLGNEQKVTFDRFEYSPGLIATPSAQFSTGRPITAVARSLNAQQNQGFTIFIEARGSYDQLTQFLHRLEKTAPLSSIAFVEISNSLQGHARAKIEIMTHYYTPNLVASLGEDLPVFGDKEKETLERLEDFVIPRLDILDQKDLIGGKADIFSSNVLQTMETENQEAAREGEGLPSSPPVSPTPVPTTE